MTGPSWLVDSKRIATKIKYASESVDPSRVKWISNPSKACPRCNHTIDNSDVLQEWPGLPQGVKFDPSDPELLGHLVAKVEKGGRRPHPFINEFIPTVTEDDGICYTHPQKLPGVKLDGSVSHFFHRTFKAYNTGTRKRRKIQQSDENELSGRFGGDVRWHKTGKTKPVIIDGVHVGCKKIMVLYSILKKGEKPEKTNWVMHQYHLGTGEDEKDGEFVVSKIFYQQQQPLKPSDNIMYEVQEQLPMVSGDPVDAGNVAATTTPTEFAIGESHPAALRLEDCAEDYDRDQEHPEQASSSQGVDNGVVLNENGAIQSAEPEKADDQDTDNQLNNGEDAKWWEGESQYLLDSQQLAEGIALCDEFLQSQSSYGGEVEEAKRMKPCFLSEYARKGGVDALKKDLEECQTLSLNPQVAADQKQHASESDQFDTSDMRLSQLEFGSQDFLA